MLGTNANVPGFDLSPAWSGVDHQLSSYPKLIFYIKAKTQ